MSSNDALERLKKRQRPTVPSRDTSLTPISPDISISRNLEAEEQSNLSSQISESPEPKPSSAPATQSPVPRSSQPAEMIPPLKTKQTTLRMEANLSDRLQSLCRDHGLSREVLIEAMFEYCEQSPEALATVLAEAETKNEYRQQGANQRRAQSMMKRFGG
jgi:hypothetical protein